MKTVLLSISLFLSLAGACSVNTTGGSCFGSTDDADAAELLQKQLHRARGRGGKGSVETHLHQHSHRTVRLGEDTFLWCYGESLISPKQGISKEKGTACRVVSTGRGAAETAGLGLARGPALPLGVGKHAWDRWMASSSLVALGTDKAIACVSLGTPACFNDDVPCKDPTLKCALLHSAGMKLQKGPDVTVVLQNFVKHVSLVSLSAAKAVACYKTMSEVDKWNHIPNSAKHEFWCNVLSVSGASLAVSDPWKLRSSGEFSHTEFSMKGLSSEKALVCFASSAPESEYGQCDLLTVSGTVLTKGEPATVVDSCVHYGASWHGDGLFGGFPALPKGWEKSPYPAAAVMEVCRDACKRRKGCVHFSLSDWGGCTFQGKGARFEIDWSFQFKGTGSVDCAWPTRTARDDFDKEQLPFLVPMRYLKSVALERVGPNELVLCKTELNWLNRRKLDTTPGRSMKCNILTVAGKSIAQGPEFAFPVFGSYAKVKERYLVGNVQLVSLGGRRLLLCYTNTDRKGVCSVLLASSQGSLKLEAKEHSLAPFLVDDFEALPAGTGQALVCWGSVNHKVKVYLSTRQCRVITA